MRGRLGALAVSFAAAVVSLLGAGALSAQAAERMSVHVLSDRADLISGGEALVAVTIPPKAKPGTVNVTLNGASVTGEVGCWPKSVATTTKP